jgi:hypothetical protein
MKETKLNQTLFNIRSTVTFSFFNVYYKLGGYIFRLHFAVTFRPLLQKFKSLVEIYRYFVSDAVWAGR